MGMRVALQSIWTWGAILVLMVLWVPLLALMRVFDRDPAYYHTGRWMRRLGMVMTKVNPAWQIEISGETIENPRYPYIVVSNHQSSADIPIISCLPWEMKWVAKAELFKMPLLGWLIQLAGAPFTRCTAWGCSWTLGTVCRPRRREASHRAACRY